MSASQQASIVLVTGACGYIGRELCRALRAGKRKFLPIDIEPDAFQDVLICDLRQKNDVSRLFEAHPIRAVIHLAGMLPSAFRSDPLLGAEVNLNASLALLRQAVNAGVQRFVFASSMSVYGSFFTARSLTENDPAVPDEPYGGSKRAIELIGETLATRKAIEFVSLRIARVIGPGVKKTSSPWRSQMFDPPLERNSIQIPFDLDARLSLVHVHDVARMLLVLVEAAEIGSCVYNTPAEIWEARHLKEVVEEVIGIRVELGQIGSHGGPLCDGSRFVQEFGFQLRGLRDHLSDRKDAQENVRMRSTG
jgi:nucleoside-diphosphate-sugar epimerase